MKVKLLLIDPDPSYLRALNNYLRSFSELEIVDATSDGAEGMRLLNRLRPDIVLMDMLQNGVDGISLLKQAHRMGRRPRVICQSAFFSEACVEAARRNGADYFIFKPSSLGSVATVILEFAGQISDSEHAETAYEEDVSRRRIHEIIHSMGFSSRYQGSMLLEECVLLALESPAHFRSISTGIYYDLSLKLHTQPSSIERNIRTAISAANADGRLNARIGEVATNKSCVRYIVNVYHSMNENRKQACNPSADVLI